MNSTGTSSKDTQRTPLTREELYALVWAEPMLRVGERFKVSSSYLARICKRMNVPRPERGYWAKLAVGKAPNRPSLPDALPGDESVWAREGEYPDVRRSLPRTRRATRKSRVKITRIGPHELIHGAKEFFEASRYKTESGYLKPDKKNLVDLIITKENLEKGLAFAERLFSEFEKSGYRVVLVPKGENFCRAKVDEHEIPRHREYDRNWSPWRCTVVYIGSVAFGLTIIELSEEVEARYVNGSFIKEADYIPPRNSRQYTWTAKHDFPTGRLCLQAYSPYSRVSWIKQWREEKNKDLNTQVHKIIRELKKAAPNIARLVEKEEIQAEIERKEWEAERERWRKEEEERRAAKALNESRTDLLNIIAKWAEANRIEQFFREAEQKISELDECERLYLMDRLNRARQIIGSINPLDYFKIWKSPNERMSR